MWPFILIYFKAVIAPLLMNDVSSGYKSIIFTMMDIQKMKKGT